MMGWGNGAFEELGWEGGTLINGSRALLRRDIRGLSFPAPCSALCMWGCKKMLIWNLEESSHLTPDCLHLDLGLPRELQEFSACCLSLPVYGILFLQPELTDIGCVEWLWLFRAIEVCLPGYASLCCPGCQGSSQKLPLWRILLELVSLGTKIPV